MTAARRADSGDLARRARGAALALGVLVSAALAGCQQGELPSRITSLAVLPADVAPYHQMTERATGEYVTQALAATPFRVVGSESTSRLLAGPRGQDLYRRFKDQAKVGPEVALPVAQLLADTTNTQGLLFSSLAVSSRGPVEGRVALTLSLFDRYTGLRVWLNRRERGYVGQLGDPGFLMAVREMANELVNTLPRPSEEDQ